jgi:hypothetical protein
MSEPGAVATGSKRSEVDVIHRKSIFLLILLGFSAAVSGQELDLRVSFSSTTIERSAKKVMVTVTITNRSDAVLKTKKLNSIAFGFFRNTPVRGYNHVSGDKFSAGARVKKAKLKKGESLSFEVNLAKLVWFNSSSSIVPLGLGPNLPIIPNYMRYFAASICLPSPKPKTKQERRTKFDPPSCAVYSNEVNIEIVPRGF